LSRVFPGAGRQSCRRFKIDGPWAGFAGLPITIAAGLRLFLHPDIERDHQMAYSTGYSPPMPKNAKIDGYM
jgi:hypothetical protein